MGNHIGTRVKVEHASGDVGNASIKCSHLASESLTLWVQPAMIIDGMHIAVVNKK